MVSRLWSTFVAFRHQQVRRVAGDPQVIAVLIVANPTRGQPRSMTVLSMTRCPTLHEEISRLAAAADVEPRVVGEPIEAIAEWGTASVVLVGEDVAAELAGLSPGRRDGVHLIARSVMAPTPVEDVFKAAIALGAESVLELPTSNAKLVDLLTDLDDPPAAGVLIGVVGGSGGVGATTLSCALAQGAAGSGRAMVVDTDPLGPGLDRLLGMDDQPGVRWNDLQDTEGRLGSRMLRDCVPRAAGSGSAGPGVLTWSPGQVSVSPGVLRETLAAARRGHDMVVLDLARHASTTIELISRCDVVFVVARASVAGLASAMRLVSSMGGMDLPATLVLRPGGIRLVDAERATGLRVSHQLGHQRGLSQALDLGLGPLHSRRGPLARVVRDMLRQVEPQRLANDRLT